RVRHATRFGTQLYHGHSIGTSGRDGSERRGSAHHPIRAVWQLIDRPPCPMAGGTVPQSSLSRRGSDSARVAIVGVCFVVVQGGRSPALPGRPWRGSSRG